jgi:hypothetical protein
VRNDTHRALKELEGDAGKQRFGLDASRLNGQNQAAQVLHTLFTLKSSLACVVHGSRDASAKLGSWRDGNHDFICACRTKPWNLLGRTRNGHHATAGHRRSRDLLQKGVWFCCDEIDSVSQRRCLLVQAERRSIGREEDGDPRLLFHARMMACIAFAARRHPKRTAGTALCRRVEC